MNQQARYTKFEDDMLTAGLEVEHYRGRFFYQGPAVRTKDIQEVIRATDISLQWGQMGKTGWIVYPD